MIKIFLFLSIILVSSSCNKKEKTFIHNGTEIPEDYILVEFASKLEEDYHRLDLKNDVIHESPQPEIDSKDINNHENMHNDHSH